MDRRREPRFDVSAQARVSVLGRSDLDLACSLLEISATGVKLLADKSILMDGIVGIELEDHFVLADVRYTQPRGDKFTIGAERVYTAGKSTVPQNQDKDAQLRAVVRDFHASIRARISGMAPMDAANDDVPVFSPAQLSRLDRQLQEYFNQPANSAVEDNAQASKAVEQDVRPESVENPPAGNVDAEPDRFPGQWKNDQGASFSHSSETPLQWRGVWLQPGSSIPPAAAVEPAPVIVPIEEKVEAPVAPISFAVLEESAEDTEEETDELPKPKIVKEEPEEPEESKFSWRIPLSVAATVTLAWSVFLFYDWSKSGAAANASTDATVAASEQNAKRHVQIRVIQPTWVRASSDGRELFAKLIPKGEVKEIEYSQKALVRVGNTNNVEVILNGKPIPLGDHGRVRLIELTAGTYRFLPAN